MPTSASATDRAGRRRFHPATAIYVALLAGMAVLAFGLTTDPEPIGRIDRALTKAEFVDPPGDGKWFGVTTDQAPGSRRDLQDFALAAGKAPSVWMYWRDWSAPLTADDIEAAAAQDVVPMIAWEPWIFDTRDRADVAPFALDRIVAGDWDDLIDESARAVVDAGELVVMRFAHEMNGSWYPWGVGVNGNGPGDYAAAWRHVWDRFQAAGANEHAVWVWSPNNVRVTTPPLEPLYPGDRYVDVLGTSGFLGYGTLTETRWPDFQSSFLATLVTMRVFTDKPMIITEMGALEKGTLKTRWMESVFDGIEATDDIIGFLWFQIDKGTDWRIDTTEASRRVFASRVASVQYL